MKNQVKIEIIKEFNKETAADLGKLEMSLSSHATGEPVSEKLLKDIILSPYHDQLIAYDEDRKIVGTATMSVVLGFHAGKIAYLEDFVVDSEAQGLGIGSRLWESIIDWSKQKGCSRLEFTSSNKRDGAIDFYIKRGAELRDTNVFRLNLK